MASSSRSLIATDWIWVASIVSMVMIGAKVFRWLSCGASSTGRALRFAVVLAVPRVVRHLA